MKTANFLPLLAALAVLAFPTSASAQRGQRDPMEALEGADSNDDGIITRAEFAAARAARFGKMDRNGDGAISRDDFGRLIQFRPSAGQRLDAMLAEADANHDGRLTREEQAKAPMPLFDRLDANKDDRVDAAEKANARQARANR